MKYLNRFLWWCAGANIEILEKCPTDQSKYFGMGGTILFTALMASFAGGYAFFTAFKDVPLSIFFGLFWGAMIFNLDRFIVSSAGKGDGTVKITKEEWTNAIPRLILAIIIGFVVAVPLELKVFEREIQVEVEEIISDERKKLKAGLNDIRDEIQELKNRKSELENELKKIGQALQGNDVILSTTSNEMAPLSALKSSKEKEFNKIKGKYEYGYGRIKRYEKKLKMALRDTIKFYSEAELEGYRKKISLGETAVKKYGSRYKKLKKEIAALKRKLNPLIEEMGDRTTLLKSDFEEQQEKVKNEKANIDEEIKEKQNELKGEENKAFNKAKQFDGLMAQLIALDRLSVQRDTIYSSVSAVPVVNQGGEIMEPAPPRSNFIIKESKTPVFYAKWMISILLICIEITPILFKMMTEAGPYDDRLDEIAYESEIAKRKYISDINEKINTELKLNNELHNNKIEAELLANKKLLTSIAEAQAEIAAAAIESWKKEQLAKASSNHNSIIVTGIQGQNNGNANGNGV